MNADMLYFCLAVTVAVGIPDPVILTWGVRCLLGKESFPIRSEFLEESFQFFSVWSSLSRAILIKALLVGRPLFSGLM